MQIEMHTNQSTNNLQESTAHSTSRMSTQRQRLRATVDKNADLFDPPNTAEAFARLEAAMDEANHISSADSDIAGKNDMLDPPNTAERFARIEAAMDAVSSESVTAAQTRRHRKTIKLETRFPVRLTHSQAQPCHGSDTGDNSKLGTGKLHQRSVHDTDKLVNDIAGPAERAQEFAGTGPTHGSKRESQRDTDIFRSSVAIDEFANKAYQSAREKYL
jgi:hypothetical protein